MTLRGALAAIPSSQSPAPSQNRSGLSAIGDSQTNFTLARGKYIGELPSRGQAVRCRRGRLVEDAISESVDRLLQNSAWLVGALVGRAHVDRAHVDRAPVSRALVGRRGAAISRGVGIARSCGRRIGGLLRHIRLRSSSTGGPVAPVAPGDPATAAGASRASASAPSARGYSQRSRRDPPIVANR